MLIGSSHWHLPVADADWLVTLASSGFADADWLVTLASSGFADAEWLVSVTALPVPQDHSHVDRKKGPSDEDSVVTWIAKTFNSRYDAYLHWWRPL
eukprot:2972070-Pyramimonas_sp.AAC.2